MNIVSNSILKPLHQVRIACIGAGGTGSYMINKLGIANHALINLSHVGISVDVIDDDIVEEHNVARQAFSMADIGRYKADVICERVNQYFGTSWQGINQRVDDKFDFKEYDIIISCVDNVKARMDIHSHYQAREDLVWIDLGNSKDSGQVILGSRLDAEEVLECIVTKHPNLSEIEEADESPSCSMFDALDKQDLFINATLAEFGADLLYKLLRYGFLEVQGCYVNMKTYNVAGIPINFDSIK